jgi:HNH endonuclease
MLMKKSDLSESVIQRFHQKYKTFAGHLIWTGSFLKNGYGVLGLGRRGSGQAYAHRISYVLTHGEIPEGMLVLHKCDIAQCVKPEHLFLGTAKDNSEDMTRKGRHACHQGTRAQKLTATDVERIKDLRAAGCTQREIGDWLGITDSMVCMILSGKRRVRDTAGNLVSTCRSSENHSATFDDELHH